MVKRGLMTFDGWVKTKPIPRALPKLPTERTYQGASVIFRPLPEDGGVPAEVWIDFDEVGYLRDWSPVFDEAKRLEK